MRFYEARSNTGPFIFAVSAGCESDSAVDCGGESSKPTKLNETIMKIAYLLFFAVFAGFAGACSSDSPIDCAEIPFEDCEAKGCSLLSGHPHEIVELCWEDAVPYACTPHQQCDDVLTIGIKDRGCSLFASSCLPDGWEISDPEKGDCNHADVDAPFCNVTTKCEDLLVAECTGPRCQPINGRRFVASVGGTNNSGCLEAPEPLGCEPITINSNDSATPSKHDGECYVFPSENLPKGWVSDETCPSDYQLIQATCE